LATDSGGDRAMCSRMDAAVKLTLAGIPLPRCG